MYAASIRHPARAARTLLLCTVAACAADAPEPGPGTALAADSAGPVISPSADTASGPLELAALEQIWTEQRYAEVLPLLKRHRADAAYGRNEVVDYMIATSACRVTGEEALGQRMFAWILDHYSLDPASREAVSAELGRCPPPAAQLVPIVLVLDGAGPASASSTRGKMFYEITRGGDVPLANQPVKVKRVIPPAELDARLFPPERAADAVAAVQQLAGEGYRVLAEGPFVVASRTHTEAEVREIGGGLARYLDFYADAYGLTRPPHLVTVYLTGSSQELREVAERVHGIEMPGMNIGYSFRDDLSMVGIIPRTITGTLAHELFHLMVRRNFGDVPPWLDEGMAALYEVSRVQPDGSIRGIPNWRGRVLRSFWNLRPSVSELVRADWRAFEAAADDYEPARQAASHATARYFVLFLQDSGQLPGVFAAFRERDALTVRGAPADDAVLTLERALGKSAEQLDQEFSAWFQDLDE